jgi:hypothetical protein
MAFGLKYTVTVFVQFYDLYLFSDPKNDIAMCPSHYDSQKTKKLKLKLKLLSFL